MGVLRLCDILTAANRRGPSRFWQHKTVPRWCTQSIQEADPACMRSRMPEVMFATTPIQVVLRAFSQLTAHSSCFASEPRKSWATKATGIHEEQLML